MSNEMVCIADKQDDYIEDSLEPLFEDYERGKWLSDTVHSAVMPPGIPDIWTNEYHTEYSTSALNEFNALQQSRYPMQIGPMNDLPGPITPQGTPHLPGYLTAPRPSTSKTDETQPPETPLMNSERHIFKIFNAGKQKAVTPKPIEEEHELPLRRPLFSSKMSQHDFRSTTPDPFNDTNDTAESQGRIDAENARIEARALEISNDRKAVEYKALQDAEDARVRAEDAARLLNAKNTQDRLDREEARARQMDAEDARVRAEDAARLLNAKNTQDRLDREEARARQIASDTENARIEARALAIRTERKAAKLKARQDAKQVANDAAKQAAEASRVREEENAAQRQRAENARVEARALEISKERKAAEDKARQDAEDKARQDAEVKARQDAEVKARQDAEVKARQDAEVKALQDAEDKRIRAEELAQRMKEKEAQDRLEEETRARQRAEDDAKQAAAEATRRLNEKKAQDRINAENARIEARALEISNERKAAERKAHQDAEDERIRAEEAAQRMRAMKAQQDRLEAEARARQIADDVAKQAAEASRIREEEEAARRLNEKIIQDRIDAENARIEARVLEISNERKAAEHKAYQDAEDERIRTEEAERRINAKNAQDRLEREEARALVELENARIEARALEISNVRKAANEKVVATQHIKKEAQVLLDAEEAHIQARVIEINNARAAGHHRLDARFDSQGRLIPRSSAGEALISARVIENAEARTEARIAAEVDRRLAEIIQQEEHDLAAAVPQQNEGDLRLAMRLEAEDQVNMECDSEAYVRTERARIEILLQDSDALSLCSQTGTAPPQFQDRPFSDVSDSQHKAAHEQQEAQAKTYLHDMERYTRSQESAQLQYSRDLAAQARERSRVEYGAPAQGIARQVSVPPRRSERQSQAYGAPLISAPLRQPIPVHAQQTPAFVQQLPTTYAPAYHRQTTVPQYRPHTQQDTFSARHQQVHAAQRTHDISDFQSVHYGSISTRPLPMSQQYSQGGPTVHAETSDIIMTERERSPVLRSSSVVSSALSDISYASDSTARSASTVRTEVAPLGDTFGLYGMPSYSYNEKSLRGKLSDESVAWTVSEAHYPLAPENIRLKEAIQPGHLHFHTNLSSSSACVWMLNASNRWENVTHQWRTDFGKKDKSAMLEHPTLPDLVLTVGSDNKPSWMQHKSFLQKIKEKKKQGKTNHEGVGLCPPV